MGKIGQVVIYHVHHAGLDNFCKQNLWKYGAPQYTRVHIRMDIVLIRSYEISRTCHLSLYGLSIRFTQVFTIIFLIYNSQFDNMVLRDREISKEGRK